MAAVGATAHQLLQLCAATAEEHGHWLCTTGLAQGFLQHALAGEAQRWKVAYFTFQFELEPQKYRQTQIMNLFSLYQVSHILDNSLANDPAAVIFGEDTASSVIFRCTVNLQDKYVEQVPIELYNTPLSQAEVIQEESNVTLVA